MNLEQTLNRITFLTQRDLGKKTLAELFASTSEEIGELSRELKIQYKTFGNQNKVKDEGVAGEAIDCLICGYCMGAAITGSNDLILPPEIFLESCETYIAEPKTSEMAFQHLMKLVYSAGFVADWVYEATVDKKRIKTLIPNEPYSDLEGVIENSLALVFFDEVQLTSLGQIKDMINLKLDKWEKQGNVG